MIKALCCVGVIGLTIAAVADEQIMSAIEMVMSQSCLANRRVARSVPEWGVPQRLLTEPSFTNLVRVVGTRIDSCELQFVCGLTNILHREVFTAALASCGQTVYKDAVVRWFGGSPAPEVSPELIDRFADPPATSMEGYFIDHYNESGIRNVWLNVKSRYMAIGELEQAAGIDDILSGKSKAEREMLESLESR